MAAASRDWAEDWTGTENKRESDTAGARLGTDALLALLDDTKVGKTRGDGKPTGDSSTIKDAPVPPPPAAGKSVQADKPAAADKPPEKTAADKPTSAAAKDSPVVTGKAADDQSAQKELTPKSVFDGDRITSKIRYGRVPIADGRTRQDLPEGGSLEYDSNDRLSRINYLDGTYREVKWNGNTLQSVRTRIGDWFEHLNQNGTYYDRWYKKDNSTWDGSITANEETGDYTLVESGKTDQQVNKADGSFDVVHADKSHDIQLPSGASAKFDASGLLTEVKAGDGRSASFTWGTVGKGTEVVLTHAAITSGGKTSNWQLKDGTWLCDGKKTDSKLVVDSKTGKLSILNRSGEDEVWHQSGLLERRHKDGTATVSVRCADGSAHDYAFKNVNGKNEIISESTTRGTTTEMWERKPSAPGSNDLSPIWVKHGTAVSEQREHVSLSPGGRFSFKRADGAQYNATADGKENVIHKSPDWAIYYENGHVTRADFRDGTIRYFGWDGDTVSSVTVQKPDSTTVWQRTGVDKYKAGNDEHNARITVNRNGDYSFLELGPNSVDAIRRPNGVEITRLPQSNTETERDAGRITRLKIDKSERIYNRDADGNIQSIEDSGRNTVWKRGKDDVWTAEAKDKDKPFTAPDKLVRKGNGEPADDGTSVFISPDNVLIRDTISGTTTTADTAKDVVKNVIASKNMNESEKFAFLNNISSFENRTDVSVAERTKAYKDIERMLSDKSTQPFTEQERAKIANQVVFLMANPNRNEQGHHGTCNVTSVRTALLREEPSQVSKLIADVTTTGKYVCFDKTEITPHPSSLRPGAEEQQDPLPPPARNWAGQIWDVTAVNVYWQRAERDPMGNVVPKGSMWYDQVVPQSRGDSVERLYRYYNGQPYEVANPEGSQVTRHPYITSLPLNDIYEQITGQGQINRLIINAGLGSGARLSVVKTADELHQELQKGPWPKIIQVHTSRQPFYTDSGYGSAGGAGGPSGGWHVLCVTSYDAATRNAYLDNSWRPTVDHLAKGREVPLQQLYDSTIGQYPVQASGQKIKVTEQIVADANALIPDDPTHFQGPKHLLDKIGKLRDHKHVVLGLEIMNQGTIDSMKLPDGWLPARRINEAYLQQKEDQFKLPGSDGVLNFFYRGSRLSEYAGAEFNAVLAAKPHTLSQNELAKIGMALDTLSDKKAFEMESARTIDLNGKRVLQVDGTWKVGGRKFHGILVDAGGRGTIVQELFYEATPDTFDAHVESVKKAIKTIQWKH